MGQRDGLAHAITFWKQIEESGPRITIERPSKGAGGPGLHPCSPPGLEDVEIVNTLGGKAIWIEYGSNVVRIV